MITTTPHRDLLPTDGLPIKMCGTNSVHCNTLFLTLTLPAPFFQGIKVHFVNSLVRVSCGLHCMSIDRADIKISIHHILNWCRMFGLI